MYSGKFRTRVEREPGPSTGASAGSQLSRIGKYEIEAAVRTENHARIKVFRAYDRDIGRPVVLKLVTNGSDRHLAERFRREVSTVAKLRVGNIVAVYELGEHAGLPFAALQHAGDDHLGLAIQSNRALTLLQKMLIMEQVAAGLAEAHRGGLAYVGIRPAGIALTAGESATIQDFGIVRFAGGEADENDRYAAPEEARGGFPEDLLCDVFGFGSICYQFLAGSSLSENAHGRAIGNGQQSRRALREALPECPEALEKLIARCLESARDLRYPSFDEMRDDLRPVLLVLKRARAAELWANGRKLVDAERLDEAQGVIREATQLTPDDPNGNQISTDLRVLLQRQKVRTRIEDLWRQSEESAGNRRFFGAVDILEAALRLDKANAETVARLDTMRARLSQSVAAAQLVVEAELLVAQHKLEAAHVQVLKAIELDPGDPDAPALLETIQNTIASREMEARAEEGIAKAKALVVQRSFDEALAILGGLSAETPESPLIRQWIGHVETQKREAERQSKLQSVARRAESLVAEDRFAEAVTLIESGGSEFRDDGVLADLLRQAHDGLERARILDQTIARCGQLCQQQHFDEALDAVDRALAALPAEPSLLALRSNVDAQAQSHRRAAAVREALDQIQWLLDQDRPDLAIRFVKERCAAITEEPGLAARWNDLERSLPDWSGRRFFEAVEDFFGRREAERGPDRTAAVLLPVIDEALAGTPPAALTEPAKRLRNILRTQTLIAEVRHCLAVGNTEQAERALQRGLGSPDGQRTVDSLREEIESCKKLVEDRRSVQVLVGRRQFAEAETILSRLAGPKHPETEVLSELVHVLRNSNDEGVFREQVRETALLLAREGKLDQADHVFRRLLALFPGDRTLGKDRASLYANRSNADQAEPVQIPEPPAVPRVPRHLDWQVPRIELGSRSSSAPRVAVIVGVLLVVAGGALSLRPSRTPVAVSPHVTIPVKQEAQRPALTEQPSQPPATLVPKAEPGRRPASSRKADEPARTVKAVSHPNVAKTEEPAPHRVFQLPAKPVSGADRAQTLDLPAPPSASSIATGRDGSLAIGQGLATVPPPVPAKTVPPAAAPVPLQTPAPPVRRGETQPAKLISAPAPVFPLVAKQSRIAGMVEVEATVDIQGHTKDVIAVRGNPLLLLAAKQAVLKWRYQPALVNGEPVEAKVQIKVNFER